MNITDTTPNGIKRGCRVKSIIDNFEGICVSITFHENGSIICGIRPETSETNERKDIQYIDYHVLTPGEQVFDAPEMDTYRGFKFGDILRDRYSDAEGHLYEVSVTVVRCIAVTFITKERNVFGEVATMTLDQHRIAEVKPPKKKDKPTTKSSTEGGAAGITGRLSATA